MDEKIRITRREFLRGASALAAASVLAARSSAHAAPAAISYLGDIGSASSKTSQSELVITTVAGVAAGDDIMVGFATYGDPNYTISVADDAGNTYEMAATSTCYTHGRTYLFAAYDVAALPSGSNITITHTAVDGATVAVASVFTGLAEINVLDQLR